MGTFQAKSEMKRTESDVIDLTGLEIGLDCALIGLEAMTEACDVGISTTTETGFFLGVAGGGSGMTKGSFRE